MFNKLLGRVDGADIWLIVSLVIFVAFFIGVVVFLLNMNKEKTEYLKNLPVTETEN